ncbi:MAG: ThiF family adenylyltransferase [Flavonifractor plautii]
MDERFLRTEMLLGPQAMERLVAAHVAVFGLGGVGSWCAEALARSGVGALTLVDHDTVGLTNLNRQVEATRSTLGQPKAQAMADRIRDINPDCRLTIRAEKYEAGRREDFFDQPLDYIVDCIDLVSCKLDLIETALTRGVPIVSSLGTGNKLDPGLFRITDLSKTEGRPWPGWYARSRAPAASSTTGSSGRRRSRRPPSSGRRRPRPPLRPRQRGLGASGGRAHAGRRSGPVPCRVARIKTSLHW